MQVFPVFAGLVTFCMANKWNIGSLQVQRHECVYVCDFNLFSNTCVCMLLGQVWESLTLIWRMAWWSMHKELWRKMEVQYSIVVWYSGSCTKKHDKPTDISIQVFCNVITFGFMYWHSILGWYGQPCHEQMTKIMVRSFILGWYNWSCHGE